MSPCRAIERCFAESPFVQKEKGVPFFHHLFTIDLLWFHVSLRRCFSEMLFVACYRYIYIYIFIYIYIASAFLNLFL